MKTPFIGKNLNIIFGSLFLLLFFTNCMSTRMTISPYALHLKTNEIESEILSLNHSYQPVGFGSETINEVVVTGTRSNDVGGYDTLMGNDPAIYNNYVYEDTLGNVIDFVLKHKVLKDNKGNKYIAEVEATKCNCNDRNIYFRICGPSGIVQSATKMEPDQQSYFYNWISYGLLTLGLFGGAAITSVLIGKSMNPF